MSVTLRVLISGGRTIFLGPVFCRRLVCCWASSQGAGNHGVSTWPTDPELQPPTDPSWEDTKPPSDSRQGSTETRGDTKRLRRESSTTASFLKPEISIERLQAVDSIISIVFGLKRLAWAHVDHTRTLRAWHQHEWWQLLKGRQHPDLYLEDVSAAIATFPPADLYILEKSSLSSQNAALFPVTLHLRIVEAMLYALLNAGYTPERGHRVFSMARTSVGKHFDIMVGGAKTSGVDLVQQLLAEAAGTKEQPRIRLPPELIDQYRHKCHPRGQNRNEELCDALLQALAFYELCRAF